MATLGGARSLGLHERVGSLDAGKDADLAAFALDGTAADAAAGDGLAALLDAIAGTPASLVCVAGRVLVRDGRLLDAHALASGRD
jgi:5-methylthioadenosine/S-adenosylhomocysteine deaminase